MLTQPNGGKLIFVGSRPALKPQEGKNVLAYALAKSLIFKLADLLNAEGSSKNVTASVIVPSTIDTEVNRKAMPDKDFSAWVKPEEIADAMAFICSDTGKPLRETVLKIYNRS
jgi:NAD(P)-dependent dehydrogenase (short-subunit alcohol dehydrogenase family)